MSKKKKRRQDIPPAMIDINQNWTLSVCDGELYESQEWVYYYDKEDNKFLFFRDLNDEEREQIKSLIGTRYIMLFKYIAEIQYKSLLELLDNKAVTAWFNTSDSEEDKYGKYYKFLDWNSLYGDEKYRLYKHIAPMFIDWCEKNDLKYKFIELSPPEDYLYSDLKKLKSHTWQIPRW